MGQRCRQLAQQRWPAGHYPFQRDQPRHLLLTGACKCWHEASKAGPCGMGAAKGGNWTWYGVETWHMVTGHLGGKWGSSKKRGGTRGSGHSMANQQLGSMAAGIWLQRRWPVCSHPPQMGHHQHQHPRPQMEQQRHLLVQTGTCIGKGKVWCRLGHQGTQHPPCRWPGPC